MIERGTLLKKDEIQVLLKNLNSQWRMSWNTECIMESWKTKKKSSRNHKEEKSGGWRRLFRVQQCHRDSHREMGRKICLGIPIVKETPTSAAEIIPTCQVWGAYYCFSDFHLFDFVIPAMLRDHSWMFLRNLSQLGPSRGPNYMQSEHFTSVSSRVNKKHLFTKDGRIYMKPLPKK